MKHPLRSLFEKLGLVRTDEQRAGHLREADRVAREGKEVAQEARRRRLAIEESSIRREPGR